MGTAVPNLYSGRHHQSFSTMKAFVALFSMVASALADPEAYWTPAVYTPSGLVAHANGALVPDYTPAQKAAAAAHLTAKANTYAARYPFYHHAPYHYLGKREANADADAYWTPAVYTPSGLVAHANGALVPDYTPAQKAAAAQHLTAKASEYAFKGYGLYGAYGAHTYGAHAYGAYPYHYLGKRDAEAEPEAYWTPAVYTPSGLVAHANGALVPDYTPAQKAAAAAHLTTKANEYALKYPYGAYTHAYSAHPYAFAAYPYHHLGKREADADAYWTPAVYTPSGLVAHANGALVPDYTPAQKAAAAQHLTAKANTYALGVYPPAYGTHAYAYGAYPYLG